MTEKQQEKAGVSNTYNTTNNFSKEGTSIVGGKNHTVNNLNISQKKEVADLQELLGVLIKDIEKFDDSIVKTYAHDELKEIHKDLEDIDNASPDTKSKLAKALTRLKDGSLGAIQFLKTAKDSEPAITWAMEKAAVVGAYLAILAWPL